jgi:hypothetical protein
MMVSWLTLVWQPFSNSTIQFVESSSDISCGELRIISCCRNVFESRFAPQLSFYFISFIQNQDREVTMTPHSKPENFSDLLRRVCFLVAHAFILFSLMNIAKAEKRNPPIVLEKSGGFAIGGRILVNPLNPNQTLSCDHGYMEYFQPWRARKTSIVMWHSASTQAFQNRWDGGEGFKDMFLRRNYPVFLWDGPRVGRANWACESYTYTPDYRDQGNFVAWNFGPTFQNWWPNSKFPTNDTNAWQQATMNRYVEFDTFKNVDLETDAAVIAADSGKLGQSIVYMTNSAAGLRALMTASKSNTTNIKGIIAYETAGVIYPDNANISAVDGPFGPFLVTVENFKKLAKIPKIQFVWGDHRNDFFSLYVNQSRILAQLINQYGGNAELLMLAEVGLNGSTHSPFADMDNQKIAALADKLLEENCLDEYV